MYHPGNRETEDGAGPRAVHERHWTEPRAAPRSRLGRGREHSDNSFPRHGKRHRMSKIGRGGNFGILSSCIQPSSNSLQREQPLSRIRGFWDVSGQDGAPRGQAPLSPSASRHLFLLDFEGGQVPSCPAAWEGGSVWCELTSCWGS